MEQDTIAANLNVGLAERLASTAVGGVLIARGVQKRSLPSLAGALLGADLIYRGVSGHCAFYEALGVNTAIAGKSGAHIHRGAPEIEKSITIGRPPEELFRLWSDPHVLARIMGHFADVTPVEEGVTQWRLRGPVMDTLQWTSVTRAEQPNRKLSWQSQPDSTMPNRGSVTFDRAPGGFGTIVRLRMQFEPPLGVAGAEIVKAFKKGPRAIAGNALRRFKSLAETGEVPSLEHNPSGRGSFDVV